MKNVILISLLAVLLISSGCYQGKPSKNEPIHIVPNMDHQEKYRPQAASNFFEDGATMRIPPAGTVARGELREDVKYYTGKDRTGEFIKSLPEQVILDLALLKRGRQRYNIFCSPCHGKVGDGKGIVSARGMVPPPTFHSDSLRAYPPGRVFDVITNGIRNMPPYKFQVPVQDRWAIVAFFKALQRSQNASLKDVPEDKIESVN